LKNELRFVLLLEKVICYIDERHLIANVCIVGNHYITVNSRRRNWL